MNHHDNDPIKRMQAALPAEMSIELNTIAQLKRKYVATDRDGTLAAEVNKILAEAVQPLDPALPPSLENRSVARGMALIGPTGVGKTTALKRLFAKHAAFSGYRDVSSGSPLILFSAPSPCTVIQLGRRLLLATGYPLERDLPAHRLFELAGKRLNSTGKIVLAIEEFQHVVHNVSLRDQQLVADILKALMEIERITVIISGIETLRPFLALDPQLDRRLTKVYFDQLEFEDHDLINDTLRSYVEAANIELDQIEARTKALVPRLIHASRYAFGLSVENIIKAIARCKQDGASVLKVEHFATMYAAGTGKSASENPFIVDRWHEVSVPSFDPNSQKSPPPAATKKKP